MGGERGGHLLGVIIMKVICVDILPIWRQNPANKL